MKNLGQSIEVPLPIASEYFPNALAVPFPNVKMNVNESRYVHCMALQLTDELTYAAR